jgi:hypothetical protein
MTFNTTDFAGYIVTGVLTNGTRFRRLTLNWHYANGINLWRGSVWGMKHDGHRQLLKRVYN